MSHSWKSHVKVYLSLFLVDASEAPTMQEEDKTSTLLTAAKAKELEKKVTKVSDNFCLSRLEINQDFTELLPLYRLLLS